MLWTVICLLLYPTTIGDFAARNLGKSFRAAPFFAYRSLLLLLDVMRGTYVSITLRAGAFTLHLSIDSHMHHICSVCCDVQYCTCRWDRQPSLLFFCLELSSLTA